MISSLDPNSQSFLDALDRIQQRLDNAQRQISTGQRISTVSDDPDQVSTLLQARAALGQQQQILTNLGRVKNETDTAEQSLETAVQLFDSVQTLGAQGASNTQTAAQRSDIAQQLGSVLQQMVGLAGSKVEGRYIFSGNADQQAPYTIDLTQANPVSAYQGGSATRVVEHPNGTTFAVSRTAQQIFDASDPAQNAFTTINNLRTALLANDDTAISAAVDALPKVGTYLNSQLAFYGNTQNNVADATDFGQKLTLQFQTQISGLQDADLSQAAVELTQAQVQQQAALQARANLPRTSLFNFLG
jgi:flagellar hook-associated protein 3 FlgL